MRKKTGGGNEGRRGGDGEKVEEDGREGEEEEDRSGGKGGKKMEIDMGRKEVEWRRRRGGGMEKGARRWRRREMTSVELVEVSGGG